MFDVARVARGFALKLLRKDLPYTFHLKILFMLLYELLYNVRTYIVIPIVNKYIAISSVEDYNVILAAGDCLMIPLFASSTCLMFYLIHCIYRFDLCVFTSCFTMSGSAAYFVL